MSSARGAAGAIKPKLHNVNSIYAGKNHNAVKAPGTGKHGGLQSLGKTTPAVRRMPPAVTLPSLRAESQGQDPNVNLVPQGGVGWHKENTSANGSSSETSSSLKSGGNAIGSSSGAVGVPSTGPGTHATDLRPTWAKQPSAVETRAAAAQSAIAVAASARDFPSLAAATAVTGKQSSASLTDSLKPQKSGSWRAGGSSALSKNEGDEPSSPPQIHPIGGSGYSGSSTPSRPVERQLPSRYYDGSVAPPPIPSGTYQVPNLQRSSTPPVAAQRSMEKPESRNMSQGNAAVGNVTSAAVPQTAPAVLPFPANVAVPPPNYSQPPPNFHPVQDQMRNASMLYPTPVAVGKCSSEVIQDVQNEEGAQQLQKNGLGDGGYVTECAQKPNFSESIASQNVGNGTQQGMRPIRSSDVRTTGFRRTESFDNRAWRDNDRGPTIGGMQHRYRDIPFEDSSLRSGEAEWQSTQYGYMDREAESRRWRNAGGGGRDVQRSPIDGSMNSYSRGHEDDVGRRENVEREAAIERSRQKRRIANQTSVPSESEGSNPPSTYGSARILGAYESEGASEWDRPSSRDSFSLQRAVNDGGPYRHSQKWGARQEGNGENEDSRRDASRREETEASLKTPEYRMLRRPESKDSAELPQQFSHVRIRDDLPDDDDDELQLTKLSQPATKVIKRVAPSSAPQPQADGQAMSSGGGQTAGISQPARAPCSTSPSLHSSSNQQNKNVEKRISETHQQGQSGQRGKRIEASSEEARQNGQKNGTAGARVMRSQDETLNGVPNQANLPSMMVAPPPADNIWEKRAEERESAEKERAAQRDALQQLRMQHFPVVGEQPGMVGYVDDLNEPEEGIGGSRQKDHMKNENIFSKQRSSNRHHTQNWLDNNYNGGYGQTDLNDYGQEEEEDGGGLFRGQREFVNSRVQHRATRGISLGGTRGGRGYGRAGIYGASRRGGSVPHQQMGIGHSHRQQQMHHFGERYDRIGQHRRGKRRDEQPVEEDNFANMGEFHVEDTYESVPPPVGGNITSEDPVTERDDAFDKGGNTDRRGGRQQRLQRQQGQHHRSAQQLYQPRQQQEGNRGMRTRGNGLRRTGEIRNASGAQNLSERGKRKKELNVPEEEIGREMYNEENAKPATNTRSETYRRGGMRDSQRQPRHRRYSPSQHGANSLSVQAGNTAERVGQMKSPVTSEGHDEWETASESSDVGDRQGVQRRAASSSKFKGSRRTMRPNNGQRRENTAGGGLPARAGNSSKNVKPASTTSHVAARGAQSLKEELDQHSVTGTEQQKRDAACKDGLAGLDINNAGVVVIDERPDMDHMHDDSAEGAEGGFEEVLSKKSKRLRQQQINEQLEAEERRKMKEREKQEKRKAKTQSRKMDRKSNVNSKEDRTSQSQNDVVNRNASMMGDSNKVSGIPARTALVRPEGSNATAPGSANNIAQNTLNTTVWNSSIVKERAVRQSSPSLENHPVIPSPIARPTPKTGTASASVLPMPAVSKKGVEVWAGPDDEQRQIMSKKLNDSTGTSSTKKNSVEFAASFNSPSSRTESSQYDFTFDPSLQDDSQPLSPKALPEGANAGTDQTDSSALSNVELDTNDDERLKERLDKVKDFWPGGQQFTNNLLGSANESSGMAPLVSDKTSSSLGAASSLAHGPNVAKVRPQPQASEPSCIVAPIKETTSSSSASCLPPPSPVACIPPGAYLQSLSQVPPPASLQHYSMIFGEPYNPHSTTSPPAQALFGTNVSVSQASAARSRPTSFIEQSQLFIHPPPSGTATSNMTWSNANPQLELLTGITATPPLASQPGASSVQRFQFSSQPHSCAAFGAPPPLLNSGGKMTRINGPPPPHPHQVPPPLHHPHTFMAPPPDFASMQGTTLGAVGSQRASDVTSHTTATSGLSRSSVGVLGQLPPPHLQQQLSVPHQSQTSFTASYNQAPPMHSFTAPPPPLRYPAMATLSDDASGVMAAGWNKPNLSSPFPVKYANGAAQAMPTVGRPVGRTQQPDRWAVPFGVPPHYASTLVFQSQTIGKEGNDTLQSNIERYPSQGCVSVPTGNTPDENLRTNSRASVAVSGNETADDSGQQKKTTKV